MHVVMLCGLWLIDMEDLNATANINNEICL